MNQLSQLSIKTPALIIDAEVMENNMKVMRDWLRGKNVRLRPHFKTPKTPIIAWKQMEYGASGVCAQKLGETEVLVNAGIKDVLLTNQIVDEVKIGKLVNLRKYSEVKVLVDNAENVKVLSRYARRKGVNLGVLVESDVGMTRCGLSNAKEALELAKLVDKSDGLAFKGLQCYSGHLQMADLTMGKEKKIEECKKVCDKIRETKEFFDKEGVHPELVTGAGTGTYKYEYSELNEIQPGSYIFMDWKYKRAAPEFDIALKLLATVVSTPSRDRAIIDAGLKAISTDGGMPILKGMEGVECIIRSEEHGILKINDPTIRFNIGDKVEIYPSHCDTTINLHDNYYVTRKDDLEAIWEISARGKFY